MARRPHYPSDAADQFMVRFPDGMRKTIKAAADANNRSMNAEIVDRIARSFGETGFGKNIFVRLEVLPHGMETIDVPVGIFFSDLSKTLRDTVDAAKAQKHRTVLVPDAPSEDKHLQPPIDE